MTEAPGNYTSPKKVSSGIACSLILPHMINPNGSFKKVIVKGGPWTYHISWEFVRDATSWASLRTDRSAEPRNLNFNQPWSLRISFHSVYSICPILPIFFPLGCPLIPVSPAPAAFHPNPSCSSVFELLLPLGLVGSWTFSQGLWFWFTPLFLPVLAALGRTVHSASTSWDVKHEHPPSWWEPWPNLAQQPR